MSEKLYELRPLKAMDLFPMFKIINKIGIREFKSCFQSSEVKSAIKKLTGEGAAAGEGKDRNAERESGNGNLLESVGATVLFDIVGIIISNLPQAEADIYLLLSQISGLKRNEIAELPIDIFAGMIVDVVKKPEFGDFFTAASRLFS